MNLAIDQLLAFAALLIFLACFFIARFFLQRGAQFSLRPIAGFAALKQLLAQSIETNLPIHLSLGIAGIALVLASTAAPAQGMAERRVVASLPQLDACIDAARRDSDTPALAVGIVSSRRLVHFRGFGAKDAGRRSPDIDTAFINSPSVHNFCDPLSQIRVSDWNLLHCLKSSE